MTRTLILVLLMWLYGAAISAGASRETNELKRLDKALEFRQDYIAGRQHCIDSLCRLLEATPNSTDLMMQIAESYSGFNNDSALVYLHQGALLADGEAKLPFRWKYASLLPLAGLHEQAQREYESIPFDSIPSSMRESYYDAGRQMFSYIASSFAHYPAIAGPLKAKALEYQVMLLKELTQDSDEYKFNYCCPIKLEDVKKAWLER